MIYERVRLKLHDEAILEYEDDLRLLKEMLSSVDENASRLTMYELNLAWRMFSEEQFASFLVIHEESVENFLMWLQDKDYTSHE